MTDREFRVVMWVTIISWALVTVGLPVQMVVGIPFGMLVGRALR